MNTIDFIIRSLKNISKNILGISLKYAYDSNTNFHIVEVSPEIIRRGDDCYMEMEYKLWKEFFELYPNEDLIIGEVDESNDMSNTLYMVNPDHNMRFSVRSIKKDYVYHTNCMTNLGNDFCEINLAA